MFSVSPQLFSSVAAGARWLFAFFALMILFFAFSWHRREQKKHRARFRALPGAGNVGEMVVVSGDRQLPQDTWFPVPREGVLGSLRTCDLVVPCPGVRPHHLDFTWQDGVGLLLRPRSGCGVSVNGVPVSGQAEAASMPLVHGSYLQVGSAVLRLQLFAALDHTGRVLGAGLPGQDSCSPEGAAALPPLIPEQPCEPSPGYSMSPSPEQAVSPMMTQPYPPLYPSCEQEPVSGGSAQSASETVNHPALSAEQEKRPGPVPARRRRTDRWKEDWSE